MSTKLWICHHPDGCNSIHTPCTEVMHNCEKPPKRCLAGFWEPYDELWPPLDTVIEAIDAEDGGYLDLESLIPSFHDGGRNLISIGDPVWILPESNRYITGIIETFDAKGFLARVKCTSGNCKTVILIRVEDLLRAR